MNMDILIIIFISIIIATLILAICDIFISCIVIIAKTIAKEEITIDFKQNLIIIMICTFIICVHFLI